MCNGAVAMVGSSDLNNFDRSSPTIIPAIMNRVGEETGDYYCNRRRPISVGIVHNFLKFFFLYSHPTDGKIHGDGYLTSSSDCRISSGSRFVSSLVLCSLIAF